MTPVTPTTRAAWVGRVVSALAGTVLVGSLLWYIGVLRHGYPASLLLALAFGAVICLVVWTAQEHSPRLEAATWFSTRREESTAPSSLDYRMLRLRRDLRDALERDDRADEVFGLVRDLAAERLQARHGVDLTTDPEAAARLMTPGLSAYLARPPEGTRRRSPRDLDRAIYGIEEL